MVQQLFAPTEGTAGTGETILKTFGTANSRNFSHPFRELFEVFRNGLFEQTKQTLSNSPPNPQDEPAPLRAARTMCRGSGAEPALSTGDLLAGESGRLGLPVSDVELAGGSATRMRRRRIALLFRAEIAAAMTCCVGRMAVGRCPKKGRLRLVVCDPY